jgi:type II secretory pathway predicted ATPase ExeA
MYKDFWGLQVPPFNLTADLRFFYTNPGYLHAVETVRSAIRNRQGLILLVGEPGTGKTTLLCHFRRSFESWSENVDSITLPSPSLPFPELLLHLCQQLCIPDVSPDPFVNLQTIFQHLRRREKEGRTVVLFIDEAQHVEKDTLDRLRLLLNLDGSRGKLLQIVLVGQLELQAKLLHPDLRHIHQQIAAQCELRPLSDHEVEAFIRHRLHVAGGEQLEVFSADAIAGICFYSRAIPRLISVICDNALLAAYKSGEKIVSLACIEEVVQNLSLSQGAGHIESLPQRVQVPSLDLRQRFFPFSQGWSRRTLVASIGILLAGFLFFDRFFQISSVPQKPGTLVQATAASLPQAPLVHRLEGASSSPTLTPRETPGLKRQPPLTKERPARVVATAFSYVQVQRTEPILPATPAFTPPPPESQKGTSSSPTLTPRETPGLRHQPPLTKERPARVVVAGFSYAQVQRTKSLLPPKPAFNPTPFVAAQVELKP